MSPSPIKSSETSFKSREHIQKKEHGLYFEVLATQTSSVTLTISGNKKNIEKHTTKVNFVIFNKTVVLKTGKHNVAIYPSYA